ncbi:hypothetical protein FOZ63_024867 [Perkinsus olseni]|uniref:RAP domain-containing protein n=1 Tax=Perkinsus olseni TaxID=32597 RepID=A0A7J6RHY0_PEROL|nr:hypothetical protein FOZ62_026170 [Perkinsus olseni]KAF4720215.1 hypothetical protein FOZ63_024867 [Perkinsus olseni]
MASTSSAAVRRCALSQSARPFATAAATVATRPCSSITSDPFQLRKVLLDASRHKKKSDVLSICQQAALPPSATGPTPPTTHRLQLLATSLHRLVKHFHNTQPDLVDALCDELSEALQSTSITINEVADTLWSIGMAGGATPSRARLLATLRPSITPLLDSASSSQLSNVACAIAKLDLDWHEEVRQVMLQCRTGLGVGSTAGGVVSNICWAAARTGVRDDAFLREAAATWLSRSIATVPASATAMIFWSLGKLAPDAAYMTELFSKAREHPGLLANFGIRECASVLSGYAYVATQPPHDEIFKVAMASLRAAPRGRVSTQTIASCCWASATLTKQHGELVKASAACLVGSLMGLVLEARQGGFTPQEVSNILWSAALLLSRDEIIASAEYLLPHTSEQILGYTAQDLAVCMAALAQTGGLEALGNSFVNSALQRVREDIHDWPADATHIHAVGQLAWSIAGRPFRDVQPLLGWAAERGANTEAFVKLLWSAASTPEAQQGSLWDSADLLKFLDAFAKSPDTVCHFNQQELALVAWSLATLRFSHQVLEEQCCREARELLLGPGISSAHLSMLLWGLASNSHSSSDADGLIQEVVAQVRSRRYRFVAADSFHVAWSLAALDVFDRRVLEVLLSAAATAELDSVALQKINQVSLWSSSHGFDPSPLLAGLFRRAAESARSEATVVDSAFQDQVTECMRRAMSNNDDYRVVSEVDLSHLGCPGVIVDLAVVRHEVTDGPPHHQQQRLVLVIEANGPSHYVRSVGKGSGTGHTLCGKAVMRRNSLRRLGYPVEEISFTHWKRLDRNSRQEYVESIVKARFPPQEKFLQSI